MTGDFLAFLGISALVILTPGQDTALVIRRRAAFRHGLVSNLGNPKVAVFFTSLLPQFAGGDRASLIA